MCQIDAADICGRRQREAIVVVDASTQTFVCTACEVLEQRDECCLEQELTSAKDLEETSAAVSEAMSRELLCTATEPPQVPTEALAPGPAPPSPKRPAPTSWTWF